MRPVISIALTLVTVAACSSSKGALRASFDAPMVAEAEEAAPVLKRNPFATDRASTISDADLIAALSTPVMLLPGASGLVLPFLGSASATSTPVLATLRWVSFDVVAKVPNETYLPIHLQARGFKTNSTSVSAEFGYTNVANKRFPSIKYTTESNPSLLL